MWALLASFWDPLEWLQTVICTHRAYPFYQKLHWCLDVPTELLTHRGYNVGRSTIQSYINSLREKERVIVLSFLTSDSMVCRCSSLTVPNHQEGSLDWKAAQKNGNAAIVVDYLGNDRPLRFHRQACSLSFPPDKKGGVAQPRMHPAPPLYLFNRNLKKYQTCACRLFTQQNLNAMERAVGGFRKQFSFSNLPVSNWFPGHMAKGTRI